LIDDVRRGDLRRTISRDYRELKQFMLTEDRQKRLREMNRVKRFFAMSWWMFRALLLKLTPARRVLLAIAFFLLVFVNDINYSGNNLRINFNVGLLTVVLLLFILMLELKDKLLAQEELQAGQAIQNALMPPRSPEIAGWRLWLFTRPANDVGGDLVDFIRVNATRFGVAVGDVAGKGLKAALLSAKLQATLRALVSEEGSVKELGTKLNRIFNRDSLPNLFASLFYVEVNANSSTARFFNAGHVPPVILRGSKIENMGKGGVALGLLPDTQCEEETLRLQPNDLLFVYSDGLTDAQNESGEFFGEQRLLDTLIQYSHLSTDQLGETILKALDNFIGDARPADDVSIAIYYRLSPEDQKKCAIFADNYGRSSAIDFFGPRYGLPKSLGRHNNYWIWGPRGYTGELVIVLGGDLEDKQETFQSVEIAGTVRSEFAMPYENDLRIYVCRDLKIPLDQIWARLRHYD
jgi:serine phosphatase RsbU (regulator of sigma subunit)